MSKATPGATPSDEVLMRLLGPPPAEERTSAGLPVDRTPDPWENSIQATCECLSWRGALDNLGRRHEEDRLGETVYADFPVYTRSALVVTRSLLDRGVITREELEARMADVRGRFEDA